MNTTATSQRDQWDTRQIALPSAAQHQTLQRKIRGVTTPLQDNDDKETKTRTQSSLSKNISGNISPFYMKYPRKKGTEINEY